MEVRPRNKGSAQGGAVENLYPRLVYHHGVCSDHCYLMRELFGSRLRGSKGFLGGCYGKNTMKTLKSIPYILAGFTAMSFVAFATMSVVVLRDMAEEKGQAVGAMNAMLKMPITVLPNIRTGV